jgi:beta-glucanase (GH16 family)
VPGAWQLAFDDEFGDPALDRTKWQPNWLAGDDSSDTPPDNSDDVNCESPSQVTVADGALGLTASPLPCTAGSRTYAIRSGLVNTHRSYVYKFGYIEARVEVPGVAGRCTNFPAFWADGSEVNGVSWPAFGELDIVECLSDGLNWHFHSAAGDRGAKVDVPDPTGWHVFGANLQPGTQACPAATPDPVVATIYYDGREVGSTTACIKSTGMYVILDNDVSPAHGGPTSVPSTLRVDYVRAWRSAP